MVILIEILYAYRLCRKLAAYLLFYIQLSLNDSNLAATPA